MIKADKKAWMCRTVHLGAKQRFHKQKCPVMSKMSNLSNNVANVTKNENVTLQQKNQTTPQKG